MRHPIPPIHEAVAALQDRLQHERDGHKKPRLQMLYLLASRQALHRAEGFASYEALRRWVRQTHGVEVKYKPLYTLVRTRFKTKLNVARPSHTKKP
jgi:hypothetical protein